MVGSGFTDADTKAFRELLHLSSMRGIDSTGVYLCDTSAKKLYSTEKKEVGSSADFVEKHGWHRGSILHRTDYTLYMGHTRSRTAGQPTIANCHPFNMSRYVGAHNGTLWDWEYSWDMTGKDRTDSEMLFEKMDEIGTGGILAALEDLTEASAYAVTVFDKAKRTLTFARNKQRPLWVMINKDRPIIYWASEERFLKFARDSNDIKADIFYFEPFRMYTVGINDITLGDTCPWVSVPIKEKQLTSRITTYPSNVTVINSTTGQTKEESLADVPLTLEEEIKVSGITDYFNATDKDQTEIDWNNVANFR